MALENEKSFSDALRDAANNIGEIIRSEFQLAKIELKQNARRAITPARSAMIGGVFGLWAVGFFLLTVMFALNTVLPEWLSALIVFCIAGIIAMLLLAAGLAGFKRLDPMLERTTANVKEQVQWAKQQVR
ncbi:MAG TPA: phage holin family protein [Candidatus Aquilonibacter sp.]|nr:phage holin family protein [Candidatus Aquilonibacter sp.]